jgi:lambda family phage tail tape measure protein
MLSGGVNALFGGMLGFADGGSFTQGRVTPFATGGVVNGPVAFPMRGGLGLMGEAGPEAIMPLSRGPDGKLGVRAAGGSQPVTVVMNIHTPDVQGFQRSQSQIAARMSRALSMGARNR